MVLRVIFAMSSKRRDSVLCGVVLFTRVYGVYNLGYCQSVFRAVCLVVVRHVNFSVFYYCATSIPFCLKAVYGVGYTSFVLPMKCIRSNSIFDGSHDFYLVTSSIRSVVYDHSYCYVGDSYVGLAV